MKLQYSLEKNDYVTFLLFSASKSNSIIRKRRRNKVLIPILYLALAIVSYFIEGIGLFLILLIFGLLWFLFYPVYERMTYLKHYNKHVEENYKNRFGKEEILEFREDCILSKDYTGEGKLFLSEVEELNEIKEYFFLKLSSGASLIIPKYKIENIEQVSQYLKGLVSELHIIHTIDLTWKWK